MALPRVEMFSLGGTISSVGSGGKGVKPTLTAEDLVADVPQIAEVAEVSVISFRQAASGKLTVTDLIELASEIERSVDDEGASGVVITQGTDTIEETAFALNLLVDREAPVVVTGAMRNPTLPGADGPANLLAPIVTAASEATTGLGAIVVMNDEIHAARFVCKTHTQNPATFRSDPVGPVGWISEGKVRVVLRPESRRKVRYAGNALKQPVALLTIALGDDGRLLNAVEQQGYAGLLVEALGGGHVPSVMVKPLQNLAAKMPVILASRTGGGEMLKATYGFPGSEIDLLNRGLLSAGPLDGLKARLLLTLLLKSGATWEEVSDTFDCWFA